MTGLHFTEAITNITVMDKICCTENNLRSLTNTSNLKSYKIISGLGAQLKIWIQITLPLAPQLFSQYMTTIFVIVNEHFLWLQRMFFSTYSRATWNVLLFVSHNKLHKLIKRYRVFNSAITSNKNLMFSNNHIKGNPR